MNSGFYQVNLLAANVEKGDVVMIDLINNTATPIESNPYGAVLKTCERFLKVEL